MKLTQLARGFTLIELLIVMVILGALAALVAPNMFGKVGASKQKAAQAQIEMLGTALDAYRLDVGKYPRDLKNLIDAGGKRNWEGPYLKKAVPVDPWGNEYVYRFPGRQGKTGYDLSSLGADGREGGEKEDADVVSW